MLHTIKLVKSLFDFELELFHSIIIADINVPESKMLPLPEDRVLRVQQPEHLVQIIDGVIIAAYYQSTQLAVSVSHDVLYEWFQLAHFIELDIERMQALVV